MQTYSFFGKQSPVGERVIKSLMAKYPAIKGPGDITPAVGVANAYDGMHLAALAITAAGSTDGDAVRQGFYKIDSYDGLIKKYDKPFSRRTTMPSARTTTSGRSSSTTASSLSGTVN